MALFFIFVDGIGMGKEQSHNPFYKTTQEAYRYMTGQQPFLDSAKPYKKDNFLFKPVDARLGVEGLPQSGTGQATLFSGVNAAKIINRHFGPYPHSEIKYLLTRESLFHKVQKRGFSCYFMNAYPDIFFEQAREKQRWTCTTLMTRSANIELNREKDVRAGRAITAEIVNHFWRNRLEIDLPNISPEKAADRMLQMGKEKEVVLFEYFLTDKAGHARDMKWSLEILETLGRFLMRIFKTLPDHHSVVLSSDHGNLEDLSRKTHTLYSVPLFVQGPAAKYFTDVQSISDITERILTVMDQKTTGG